MSVQLPDDLIALPTMPWNERPVELPLDIEECRTALWKARGNVTQAAQLLKVSSMRLRRFVEKSPRLSAEQREAQDVMLDIAEDNIAEALIDPDDAVRRDNMSKFVLLNLGARRGYGPKGSGITLNAGGPKGSFTISWGDGTQFEPEDGGKVIEHDAAE